MSVLHDRFGASRDESWRQAATAVGGNDTKGSFENGNGNKVNAWPGQWIVARDTVSHNSTLNRSKGDLHKNMLTSIP
jgi:hypothetical protein